MPNFLETGLSKAEIMGFFAFQIGRRRHLLGEIKILMGHMTITTPFLG